MIHHIRDILLLTFNVAVTIPAIILHYSRISIKILNAVSGVVLITTGIIVFIWTILSFHRIGNGTLSFWQRTTNLIVADTFRYCLIPMIASNIIIVSGEAILFGSL